MTYIGVSQGLFYVILTKPSFNGVPKKMRHWLLIIISLSSNLVNGCYKIWFRLAMNGTQYLVKTISHKSRLHTVVTIIIVIWFAVGGN